ncbi:alpha-2-macroglobulin-like isoform X2 [Hoplias malabaricus]
MAVTGDEEIMQTFKVKKYVLPRFEVTLKAPQQQSVGEQKLKIEVCGKYSYGQPVTGKALVEVCQKFNSHYPGTTLISPCLVDAVEMKENGCATAIFNFSHFMNFDMGQNVNNFLDTTATVTEEGTDISMKTSATTEISYEIGRAEFVDVPKTFERHIVIEGKIKVTSFSGAPVPNKEVYLLEGDRWSAKLLRNLTTDDNGLVNFTVNAPKDPKTQISLLASVYPNYQHHRTTPFFRISDTSISLLQPATPYSPVYSELLIENLEEPLRCGAAISINIKYYIVGETAENYSTDIIYMVSLQFSAIEAVPGEENTLQVSALPGSLCALSAVDQSVFIMEPEERLNANKIFNLLPVKAVSTYTSDIEDIPKCTFDLPRDHTYTTVENAGIKMVTNLALRDPRCFIYEHYYDMFDMYSEYGESEPIETVRKFFPETWIWQLAEVGDSGSAQVPVTVPDTITTWETEAFCLSSKGLGVAPPSQLLAFQPFFLELSLPYSIIRGEVFELKATVFNYLSKCIMVKVTPAPSSDYTLEASSDDQYSSCLCANGRKTFKWTLIPSVLGELKVTVSAEAEQSQAVCDNEIVSVPDRGRIDTVIRTLLVKAEGTEKAKSQSLLLCPQGNSVSETLELVLPVDVIEGSARASVSVLGDILGRALKNIDGLLRMPYGCGEQNIAILAPNIYILQYLENTEQLTAAIRERATVFLKNVLNTGYQRQLNYKHFNGAYSTFGRGEDNTWLTTFVLKTFGKAQRYTFIDPENINSAKQWLINQQRSGGCYIRQGTLFNNRMKGGVNDDVTMTAYITVSLLELGHTSEDAVVSKGLSCVKSSIGRLTNPYTTALLAYTFSLAGDNKSRGELLQKLDSIAITGDGNLHWTQSVTEDSESLAVEISSYVLLAVLTTGEASAADLGYANRIVHWLVRQQNPYGGFASTQDTVVALQALALYATKVYSSDGSSTVTVQSDKESHIFEVDQSNKLLYQEKPLQDIPGKYSISVTGSTCASAQMALFYNIPTPTVPSTLSIKAKTGGDCTKSFGHVVAISFTVEYTGALHSTNMVIVDIKILSGFTADPSELNTKPLVERVDFQDDHLMMYMKKVPKDVPMNYQLHIKQVLPVKNLKPAVIRVYDYYQTSDQSETEYSFPCV